MFNIFTKNTPVKSLSGDERYRAGGRKDRILHFFQERKGEEIGLNVILKSFRDIADPTRTIRYLEADGYDIVNHTTRTLKDGVSKCYSTYTYCGYVLMAPKEKKRTKREEAIYEEGFQACMAIYGLK